MSVSITLFKASTLMVGPRVEGRDEVLRLTAQLPRSLLAPLLSRSSSGGDPIGIDTVLSSMHFGYDRRVHFYVRKVEEIRPKPGHWIA